MRIALIGMSGSGKSFWSSILSRHGFQTISCDDAIGRRLAGEGEISNPSIDSLGRWMGFPFDPDFARKQARYLTLEGAVMDEILQDLETGPVDAAAPHLVIDTTGSVIYTGETMMQRLRQQTLVIYLSLPGSYRKTLRRAYQMEPRPVIWGQYFNKRRDENDQEALKRCYDDLLESRELLYRRYAHLEVGWDPSDDASPEAETLLAPIRAFMARQDTPNAV